MKLAVLIAVGCLLAQVLAQQEGIENALPDMHSGVRGHNGSSDDNRELKARKECPCKRDLWDSRLCQKDAKGCKQIARNMKRHIRQFGEDDKKSRLVQLKFIESCERN